MKRNFPRCRLWSALPAIALAGILSLTDSLPASETQVIHESRVVEQIQNYCAASWRNAGIPRADWSDCSQQVFAELLERVPRNQLAQAVVSSESRQRRELNRSIWRIAKRWLRAVRHRSLNRFDTPDPATLVSCSTEEAAIEQVFRVAGNELSTRQSRILELICTGHSISEIAKQLGVPAARVSDEKYRAIQNLRRHLCNV